MKKLEFKHTCQVLGEEESICDPTEFAQILENGKSISKEEFFELIGEEIDLPKQVEFGFLEDKMIAWFLNIKKDIHYIFGL